MKPESGVYNREQLAAASPRHPTEVLINKE